MDAAGVDKLIVTLGAGGALQSKINAELTKQGLSVSSGVSPVDATAGSSSASSDAKTSRGAENIVFLARIIAGGVSSVVVMVAAAP